MRNKTSKLRKTPTTKKNRVYTRRHYESNDGMLTTVWGPSTWHLLHTMSFNYPVKPTCDEKREYREFVLKLQYVLPCGKCRKNLRKNFEKLPLLWKHMATRSTFSKYIYKLHELVNTMLHKTSGLSYNDVRERYEHFRSRCSLSTGGEKLVNVDEKQSKEPLKEKSKAKEDGCTEPIYGEKSKCVLQIVPQKTKCDTFQMDEKCIKQLKPSST